MHLYGQSSINNVLLGPNYLNPRLISFHTLSMFYKTNDQSLFDKWGMHVSKRFSTPNTNTSLSSNKPHNIKSTMGFILGRVVDAQMPMSNLLLHNSKNCWELRCKLTSLFPHLCGRIMDATIYWISHHWFHIYNQKLMFLMHN
jgi:hypothetical protein